jgi:hypothetical protein
VERPARGSDEKIEGIGLRADLATARVLIVTGGGSSRVVFSAPSSSARGSSALPGAGEAAASPAGAPAGRAAGADSSCGLAVVGSATAGAWATARWSAMKVASMVFLRSGIVAARARRPAKIVSPSVLCS